MAGKKKIINLPTSKADQLQTGDYLELTTMDEATRTRKTKNTTFYHILNAFYSRFGVGEGGKTLSTQIAEAKNNNIFDSIILAETSGSSSSTKYYRLYIKNGQLQVDSEADVEFELVMKHYVDSIEQTSKYYNYIKVAEEAINEIEAGTLTDITRGQVEAMINLGASLHRYAYGTPPLPESQKTTVWDPAVASFEALYYPIRYAINWDLDYTNYYNQYMAALTARGQIETIFEAHTDNEVFTDFTNLASYYRAHISSNGYFNAYLTENVNSVLEEYQTTQNATNLNELANAMSQLGILITNSNDSVEVNINNYLCEPQNDVMGHTKYSEYYNQIKDVTFEDPEDQDYYLSLLASFKDTIDANIANISNFLKDFRKTNIQTELQSKILNGLIGSESIKAQYDVLATIVGPYPYTPPEPVTPVGE